MLIQLKNIGILNRNQIFASSFPATSFDSDYIHTCSNSTRCSDYSLIVGNFSMYLLENNFLGLINVRQHWSLFRRAIASLKFSNCLSNVVLIFLAPSTLKYYVYYLYMLLVLSAFLLEIVLLILLSNYFVEEVWTIIGLSFLEYPLIVHLSLSLILCSKYALYLGSTFSNSLTLLREVHWLLSSSLTEIVLFTIFGGLTLLGEGITVVVFSGCYYLKL